MKKLVLYIVVGALSLSAVAQTAAEVDSVTIIDSHLRISILDKFYRMLPEEFYNFKGAYSAFLRRRHC